MQQTGGMAWAGHVIQFIDLSESEQTDKIAAFRWMEETEVCVSRAAVMAWNGQDGGLAVFQ